MNNTCPSFKNYDCSKDGERCHLQYGKDCFKNESEAPRPEDSSGSAEECLLCPKRYGSVSHGVTEHEDGNLLMVVDIVKALELIQEDDEHIDSRITELLCHLRA